MGQSLTDGVKDEKKVKKAYFILYLKVTTYDVNVEKVKDGF